MIRIQAYFLLFALAAILAFIFIQRIYTHFFTQVRLTTYYLVVFKSYSGICRGIWVEGGVHRKAEWISLPHISFTGIRIHNSHSERLWIEAARFSHY